MFINCLQLLSTVILIKLLLSLYEINCSISSVCKSVAPNGEYLGSRIYRQWYSIETVDNHTKHLSRLVLYTKVSEYKVIHEWHLMVDRQDMTISVNKSTFKSIDKPIVNRFSGLSLTGVSGTMLEKPSIYYCDITSNTTTISGANKGSYNIDCIAVDNPSDDIKQKTYYMDYNIDSSGSSSSSSSDNMILISPRVYQTLTFDKIYKYHMVYNKYDKCRKLIAIEFAKPLTYVLSVTGILGSAHTLATQSS
ncbi:uncharacterized protein LOC128954707 [Oppia nitens]|uniref:uncharacterized protein LOC128954707 n=1 Tax=Oppia nitens TaxID=1686743 RepID=UPI0023DC12EE|nr:uncharacterized protein LOC128954707 [Oppia nitens]